MTYNIRMGIPEMAELYKKWGSALKKLAMDPHYPSLNSHEIDPLSRRYGMKVWESYLENNKGGARRPIRENLTGLFFILKNLS